MATTAERAKPARKPRTYDIDQAAEACGIDSSLLRAWEQRHRWPLPQRTGKGRRGFSERQVGDIRRMAGLVRAGRLVGSLIQDGEPRWPTDGGVTAPLTIAQRLPAPASDLARDLRGRLLAALASRNHAKAWELLLRCTWDVHPAEQTLAGWLPCVVGLEEFRLAGQPLAHEDQLLYYLTTHLRGVLGRLPATPHPLWVTPLRHGDACAAHLAALLLSQRGCQARPWLFDKRPAGPSIAIGSAAGADDHAAADGRTRLLIIDGPDAPGLTALADGGALPAVRHAAAR